MPSLFSDPEDDLQPLAARLAPRLRSSWKYEGRLGSIYSEDLYKSKKKHSKAKFERECLDEATVAARLSGLTKIADRLPEGYYSTISEKAGPACEARNGRRQDSGRPMT